MKKILEKINSTPGGKKIVLLGLVFGLTGAILGIFSKDLLSLFSWSAPFIATALGYYTIRSTNQSQSSKFKQVFLGGVLFVFTSSLISFLINIIVITVKNEWGLGGVNILTLSGIISLILGLAIGISIQLMLFIAFGMIGSLFAKHPHRPK